MTTVELGGEPLTIDEVVLVARRGAAVALAPGAQERLAAARALVESIAAEDRAVYGINTGLGDLAQVQIPHDELLALQRNLVRSHAVGVGEPLAPEVVRAMTLLLAGSLARGRSGVRAEVVDALVAVLERGLVPRIPARGSVGASGDLAPLAHLALVVCGEGEVLVDGRPAPSGPALEAVGIRPLVLQAKEGLAFVNGTHLMAGAAALAVHDARRLVAAAVATASLTLDVLLGSIGPMDDRIHALRRRPRQRQVAAAVRALVDGSGLLRSHADCGKVQDAYSLRCIPQVVGAVAEAVDYAAGAVEPELGAVTDNPLCFPEDGDVVSGGNFHGQPLGLPLDVLAIAVAELAAFSERRSYRLLAPAGEPSPLPPFLTRTAGTSSGLMVLQYTAAALVAENAVLAHPAGVGSLPTSAGQEDFNSMGATAALKARQVLENAWRVVAIELILAAQALDLRRPLTTTDPLERVHAAVRRLTPAVVEDRSLAGDIEALAGALAAGDLDDVLAPAFLPPA